MDKAAEKKEKDKQKRLDTRKKLMMAGMAELSLWLHDLLRAGLITLPDKPRAYFEAMDRRLVDAKCPGMAALVKSLRDLDYKSGEQWQDLALDLIGRMWMGIKGFERLEALPEVVQTDLKTLAGWGPGPKEVMESPDVTAVKDHWLVAARTTEVVDDITAQRNWLFGLHTGQWALVLNFAFKKMPIETRLEPGQAFEGTVAWFPATSPLRAVVREQGVVVTPQHSLQPLEGWQAVEQHIAGMLAQSPLVEQFPVFVQGLTPLYHEGNPVVVDRYNFVIPLEKSPDAIPFLRLLAVSGGTPLDMLLLVSPKSITVMGCFYAEQYTLVLST